MLRKPSCISYLRNPSSPLQPLWMGIVLLLIACCGHAFAQDLTSPVGNTRQSEIVILLLVIVVSAGLVFLRRPAIVIIVRVFRLITRPFAKLFRFLSRLVTRIVSKAPPKQKPVQVFTGLTVDAVARALTETEQAIGNYALDCTRLTSYIDIRRGINPCLISPIRSLTTTTRLASILKLSAGRAALLAHSVRSRTP
jgi:hypothetical protein